MAFLASYSPIDVTEQLGQLSELLQAGALIPIRTPASDHLLLNLKSGFGHFLTIRSRDLTSQELP